MTAMFPGDFGKASEDCNCRCALLQRARWALTEEELETLKERAAYHGLDKAKDFEDYQQKYLKASEEEPVRSSVHKKKEHGSTENERSTRSTQTDNFDITFDRKSEAYQKKLLSLGEDEKTYHTLKNDVSAILRHRGGTNYEDLSFISTKNGKHKMQTKYNVEGKVKPTKEMLKLLKDNKPYTVIGIHNHPRSTSPSVSDLKSAYEKQYKYGLVICHDGKIFKYKVTKPILEKDEMILELKLSRLDKALKSDRQEEKNKVEKILEELYDLGVELGVM